tara:strand:- start:5764 stop:6351 length:588 start_codon:yes stop_codon:yes gene_type:complete
MAFKMAGFSGPFKKTYEGEVKSIPQEVKPIVREVQPSQNIIPNNRQYIEPTKQNMAPMMREVNPPLNIDTHQQRIKPIRNLKHNVKNDFIALPEPVPYRSSYFKNPTTKQQKLNKKRKLDYKPQSSFKQAGTEDASPGGGTPPTSKPTIKSVQKRISDLKLHKQTNTKEYKDLVKMLNSGYGKNSGTGENTDEVD